MRASSPKLTSSLLTFILREWICMILARPSSVGCGSSIFLSSRPDRNNAGSNTSGRFVAAITFTWEEEEEEEEKDQGKLFEIMKIVVTVGREQDIQREKRCLSLCHVTDAHHAFDNEDTPEALPDNVLVVVGNGRVL